MRYPVTVAKIEGEYVATLSHPNGRFQGACVGDSRTSALNAMRRVLAEMIASAIRDGEEIPAASGCDKGNASLILPPMLAAKAAIYMEMRTSGKRKADMARAMNVNQKQMDRILDPSHRSTLPQLEAAAATLGKHLDVRLA